MRESSLSLGLALLAFTGCADEIDSLSAGSHTRLTGAVFTTTEDGTTVDGNDYEHVCDVYLNGGPHPDGAAGLPEGDYYFQVTDPSGATLLSNDSIATRQIHIDAAGRIDAAVTGGLHATGVNLVDGGITVQLCPVLPSPNPGCVYKVWVTPVEDYDPTLATGVFGFSPRSSRTDGFRSCGAGGEVPGEEIGGTAPPHGPGGGPPFTPPGLLDGGPGHGHGHHGRPH